MLCYERIDVSEEIHISKTSASKEYDICHYQYFLDKGLKFQLNVYNGCHDVLMMSINFKGSAILKISGVDYCCIINGIDTRRAENLLKNADLTEGREVWVKILQRLPTLKLKNKNFTNTKAQF